MTAKMLRRRLGKDGPEVTAPGLGLMSLSMGYGKPGNDEERLAFLDRAWELGCRTWDTADAYGDNEDLVGKWFRLHPERRQDIFLCSKFGFVKGGLDSSPGHCREACEKSLDRLGVNHIDLYYIHRVDGKTPIEKTMEELARLKSEGKINYIGISAASSTTVRRACCIAPVTAVQVEYSPWATDIEGEAGTHLLQTCRELGIAIVAYAPLGRGFLTGQIKSPDDFEKGDVRKGLPRFSKENFAKNLVIVDNFRSMAAKKGCKPGQLALSWVMAQGEDFIPIPGTKNIKYLEENVGGAEVVLSEAEEKEIRTWVANVEGETKTPGNVLDYGDTPHL